MIIYKTINKINNKIYVGQSIYNDSTYLGSGKMLKYAIAKYGAENFIKEIIEENEYINLNNREIYWISKLNACNPKIGYNIHSGGQGGNLGLEANEKRRKTLMGHFVSDKTKEKISEANKGKPGPNLGKKFSKE